MNTHPIPITPVKLNPVPVTSVPMTDVPVTRVPTNPAPVSDAQATPIPVTLVMKNPVLTALRCLLEAPDECLDETPANETAVLALEYGEFGERQSGVPRSKLRAIVLNKAGDELAKALATEGAWKSLALLVGDNETTAGVIPVLQKWHSMHKPPCATATPTS